MMLIDTLSAAKGLGMRAGLVAYFDLGYSMGLTDHAFRDEYRRALPEIGMIGLINPLGQGAAVDLLGSHVLAAWRTEAIAQVRRPEMELGWQKEWIDLNIVVVALASLTLVSVTVDAYNFIREEGTIIEERVQRALLLGQFVMALAVLALAVWIITVRRNRRRRQARSGRRTDRR